MGLEDEYRKHAGNLLDMASRQRDSADKSRLLSMAEAWLDLADRIAIKKERATVDHPLVENVLGPNRASTEMPRYHFVIHAPDYKYDDPDGMHFPNHEAARQYGHRIARELREGGHEPGSTLHVLDETGQRIQAIDV